MNAIKKILQFFWGTLMFVIISSNIPNSVQYIHENLISVLLQNTVAVYCSMKFINWLETAIKIKK